MSAHRPPAGRTVPGNRWDLLAGLAPAAPPRVSVVVAHHRQQPQLDRTLAALARQSHPAERLEVLVVDDGSPEAPSVPPGVTLLRQEDRGFRAAAARNLGARHASGDVLCFLDADTVPEPGYVAALTRLPALAPEAVTVGRRRHADLSALPSGAPVEEAAPGVELAAPAWLAEAYARSGDLLHADHRSYRYVISAVLSCSAWLHEYLGGFDEGFAEYGGEDWEWAHRAWLGGAVLAHVREAVAWHDGPDWAGRGADDAVRRAAKNREALRLADAIPVPGSRGVAVRSRGTDVLVRVPPVASAAIAFECVDTLLAALPEATVVVADADAPVFAGDPRVVAASSAPDPAHVGARVVVELTRALRVVGAGLREVVDRAGVGALGAIELTAEDGDVVAVVTGQRATARALRWGRRDLFDTQRQRARWLAPIDGEPDLEAHLGGWGSPATTENAQDPD